MKTIKLLVLLALLGVVAGAGIVWSGVYHVGADDPHWGVTYWLLDTARDRSIAVRAADEEMPDLSDAALIKSGAGNYSAMCVSCHLSPGAGETELSIGLYPRPPKWDHLAKTKPREAFWVLKHGIKASGMPAWGKSMDDRYLWGMVAFIGQFDGMSADQYAAQVTASDGHSHGGGESNVGMGDGHHDGAVPVETGRSSFEPVEDPMAAPTGESPDHHGGNGEQPHDHDTAMPPADEPSHKDGHEH
jgi:prepilin-type processing-associated H-X9-DG protein